MATWMLFQQFPCSQHRIQNQHIAKQWYKSPHMFELLRILVKIIPFLACNSAAVFAVWNLFQKNADCHIPLLKCSGLAGDY